MPTPNDINENNDNYESKSNQKTIEEKKHDEDSVGIDAVKFHFDDEIKEEYKAEDKADAVISQSKSTGSKNCTSSSVTLNQLMTASFSIPKQKMQDNNVDIEKFQKEKENKEEKIREHEKHQVQLKEIDINLKSNETKREKHTRELNNLEKEESSITKRVTANEKKLSDLKMKMQDDITAGHQHLNQGRAKEGNSLLMAAIAKEKEIENFNKKISADGLKLKGIRVKMTSEETEIKNLENDSNIIEASKKALIDIMNAGKSSYNTNVIEVKQLADKIGKLENENKSLQTTINDMRKKIKKTSPKAFDDFQDQITQTGKKKITPSIEYQPNTSQQSLRKSNKNGQKELFEVSITPFKILSTPNKDRRSSEPAALIPAVTDSIKDLQEFCKKRDYQEHPIIFDDPRSVQIFSKDDKFSIKVEENRVSAKIPENKNDKSKLFNDMIDLAFMAKEDKVLTHYKVNSPNDKIKNEMIICLAMKLGVNSLSKINGESCAEILQVKQKKGAGIEIVSSEDNTATTTPNLSRRGSAPS